VRDVVSEVYFKDQNINSNPIYVLFVYSVVTQAIAFGIMAIRRTGSSSSTNLLRSALRKENVLVNVFTLSAFLFYFLAIASPLGAAMNALVDFGVGPTVTALVGAFLARDRLDRTFLFSAAAAVLGIVVLAAPRFRTEHVSALWISGVGLALLSALSAAFYTYYFKVLLDDGVDKAEIVLLRMSGISLVLGMAILIRPELFSAELLLKTTVIGLIGFALPLFLSLTILQGVTIRGFAMLLFLYPVLTYSFSASIGLVNLYISDLLAGFLILVAVGFHEIVSMRKPE
jgi:drug/metabolite transporter (DMT)-like permease